MRKWRTKLVAMGMLGLALAPALLAQTPPGGTSDPSASERAQREGDKVFKWIIINADKPKKAVEVRPAVAKPAAPRPASPVAPVPDAVARVKDEGITEKVEPILAPAVAVVPAVVPDEPAAPAPAGAGASLALALPVTPAAQEAPDAQTTLVADDVPLELTQEVDPKFPVALMQRLIRGSVRVRFEVQPDGSVKDTEVLKTSNARLNDAAQEAVAKWRFKPIAHTQYGMVELAFNIDK